MLSGMKIFNEENTNSHSRMADIDPSTNKGSCSRMAVTFNPDYWLNMYFAARINV